jgi:AraC-like DNA-binding protein
MDDPSVDPLTQTVSLLRPRALFWKQLEAAGDWALQFPANNGVVFCLVAAGDCVFQAEGHAPRALGEGDFVLMASPPDWTIGATAQSDVLTHHRGPGRRTLKTRLDDGSGGPRASIVGGHFMFDAANAALREGLLPRLVAIRAQDAGASRLRAVLDLIGDEANAERPGRSLVLERLLEVMLIEAIRHGATLADHERRGLLAGLADPQIAIALRALHADIARRWSVAELAKIAGVSRSVFSERFSRVVGAPPFDYLLQWRMARAKDLLRHGSGTLAQIATTCGYQSVSAFSTAFTRCVGQPPSVFAAMPPAAEEVIAAKPAT